MAQRLRHFVLLVVALALATGIGVASVRAATMNFGTGTSGGEYLQPLGSCNERQFRKFE